MDDSGSPLSGVDISIDPEVVIVSCYAKPAKKPTNKTLLDERRYIPFSSVQPLYDHRAKVIITHTPSTSDACTTRREIHYRSSPLALLRKN